MSKGPWKQKHEEQPQDTPKSKERDLTKNSEESEKAIERYLVKRVKELGGLCLKYTNPRACGYPDRIILFEGAPDVWVEVKSRGRLPSALQTARIMRLQGLGRMVRVCDSKEKVEEILDDIWREWLV